MNGIYTMASGSVSSLYGNVTAAIRELIISKFPKDYFKYITTSTELGFHNMKRQFGGTNGKAEIKKRRKPYLVIQPNFQEPDHDTFLQEIPLTKNIDDLQYRVDRRYLMDIIRDPKYGYNLQFKINRDRIEFDVRIVVTTLHQQLDIYKAIKNQIVWERSFVKPTALEAVIPKTMMHHIGKLCKMDIQNDPYMTPILLDHLNGCSKYPITFKLRNASTTDEFYMYYMHNMVITFYDLNLEEGVKKDMVDDHHNITFRVSADFNLPGLYIISGNLQKLREWKVVLSVDNEEHRTIEPVVESEFFPLFTIDNIYAKYPPEVDGMKLMGSARFTCDKKSMRGTSDYLNISSLFSQDQEKIIKAYTGFMINPDTLVRLHVLKNKEELVLGEGYKMDWQSMFMEICHADLDATYRLVVYINTRKLNEMMAQIPEYKSREKSGLYDNTIDWDKILELQDKSGYKKQLLGTGTIQEDPNNPGEFLREHDGSSIVNMYNEEDVKDWTLESIGVITTWQGAFDGIDKDMTLVEHDPENRYAFRAIDTDTGEIYYVVSMAEPNTPEAFGPDMTIVWEQVLGEGGVIVTNDMVGETITLNMDLQGHVLSETTGNSPIQDWLKILPSADAFNNKNQMEFDPKMK